jgi:NADP-dependent 3-hydroxy acid dehydrogenase YdfG
MLNVKNKVIAITRASSGIGEATARLVVRKGLRVVLGARRTDRLEAIASEIRDKAGLFCCPNADCGYYAQVSTP